MKRLLRFTAVVFWFGLFASEAPAAFTSLYVFGDGVCTTTNNTGGPAYLYYGQRYCNGRVWVEVLAQLQGLAYSSNKNWSYYGQDSTNLVTDVTKFGAPPDANTALFVLWACDADFVLNVNNAINSSSLTNMTYWTPVINQSLTNHATAIQTLYAKGARTLVMPNAVDLTEIPAYSTMSAVKRTFIRQRIIDFNNGFAATLGQARVSLTNLTIYLPDMFALLNNMLTNAASYGLTNAGIDAVDDLNLTDISLDGPGASYIFWDDIDPSAKAHAVMADYTQELISPVSISQFAWVNGSNRLAVANVPIGRNGFVDASSNLVNWATVQNVTSTNATQTVVLPVPAPPQFYRLRFPFSWIWP